MLDGCIRELSCRPRVFDHIQGQIRCWAFYTSEDLCGYAAISEISSISAAIHFEWVRPITARSLKNAIRVFRILFVPELKAMGYEQLIATKPCEGRGSEAWVKLIKKFGWPEPQVVLVSTKEL